MSREHMRREEENRQTQWDIAPGRKEGVSRVDIQQAEQEERTWVTRCPRGCPHLGPHTCDSPKPGKATICPNVFPQERFTQILVLAKKGSKI